MAMFLRDIDRSLEHQNAERDARDPADEANNVEDAEEQEDDTARPVAAREHVECCDEAENDAQDSGYPNELLCEGALIVRSAINHDSEMGETHTAAHM